jgi:hypothetical protein
VLHFPAVGWLMVTVLAVIVDLEDDPLILTQSPAATEVDGTVAVWEKVVDGVQLTVTWPLCWFWTSMDDPATAATDPEATGGEPPLGVVAAPATVVPVRLATSEMPMMAAGTVRRMWGLGRFMLWCSPSCGMGYFSWTGPLVSGGVHGYSLRRASMGASRAARDAG